MAVGGHTAKTVHMRQVCKHSVMWCSGGAASRLWHAMSYTSKDLSHLADNTGLGLRV